MEQIQNILQSHNPKSYITFPLWEKEKQLVHCFTTRYGGVSKGDLSTLNLGVDRGDTKENVLLNYQIVCDFLGVERESIVLSKQVHETNIKKVTTKECGNGLLHPNQWDSVDGIYTDQKGITLVTHYADCVPLFFYHPNHPLIGMAHAGWRGTVQKIGLKMLDLWVQEEKVKLTDIQVVIGPSIGPCCFEVHKDVATVFFDTFGDAPFIMYNPEKDKYTINLWECNKYMLMEKGILEKNIYISGICTCCHSNIFFSHRKTQGQRGTLGAFMALKE